MGSLYMGTSRYDEDNKTWHMTGKSKGPFGEMTGKGTVKVVDANTMEWHWTDYTMGGFIHILLVIAVVVVLLRVIQGRRPI